VSELSKGISFEAAKNFVWTGQRPSHPLAGRTAEFGQLVQAFDQAMVHRGSLTLLEGEMGMGKTRVCQELLDICASKGESARYFQNLPAILESDLSDLERQSASPVEDALLALRSADLSTGRLIVLDDFHLIPKERHAELFQAAGDAVDFGRMVLFCGRSGFGALAPTPTVRIRLRPMPENDMQLLIWQVLDLPDDKKRVALQKIILDTATGVPLFAVEMARHPTSARPSLSLMVAVHARLDGLHLDSLLLRAVAKHPRPITATEIKAALAQDAGVVDQQLDRAVNCGVLLRDSDGTFSFSHPMIRRVIANSDMK
jgi:hypothetical protein